MLLVFWRLPPSYRTVFVFIYWGTNRARKAQTDSDMHSKVNDRNHFCGYVDFHMRFLLVLVFFVIAGRF